MKSGRSPALNDFKGRWGDPWLLGAGGDRGRERLLPKHFVAHAVIVFLKSSHWSVDSARAS